MSHTAIFIRTRLRPRSLADDLISTLTGRIIKPIFPRKTGGPISNASQLRRLQHVVAMLCHIQTTEKKIIRLVEFNENYIDDCITYIASRAITAGNLDNWVATLNFLLGITRHGQYSLSAKKIRDNLQVKSRHRFCSLNKSPQDFTYVDARIAEIAKVDPAAGAVIKILRVLPLRVREAACLNIHDAVKQANLTSTIYLDKGVKNGRPRTVHLWKKEQLATLLDLMPLSNEIHGSIIPAGVTLKLFLQQFYRLIRKMGVNRKSGFNCHGLRHNLLQEYFEHTTGFPAPIFGPRFEINQNNPTARAGFLAVTRCAGHNDETKASAYLGSIRTYKKPLQES